MKAIGRHVWRILFPRRIPSLRKPVNVIHPFFPPTQPAPQENRHVNPERFTEKTPTPGSANR